MVAVLGFILTGTRGAVRAGQLVLLLSERVARLELPQRPSDLAPVGESWGGGAGFFSFTSSFCASCPDFITLRLCFCISPSVKALHGDAPKAERLQGFQADTRKWGLLAGRCLDPRIG